MNRVVVVLVRPLVTVPGIVRDEQLTDPHVEKVLSHMRSSAIAGSMENARSADAAPAAIK